MNTRGYEQYKDQAVYTMTQGELLLLLYDELIKRLSRAQMLLEKKDYGVFEACVDRSADIVRYLDDCLDRQYPISDQLHRLYDFFGYELSRVKLGRNERELERVKKMSSELRDSFRTAQQKVDSGKADDMESTGDSAPEAAADSGK